MDSRYAFVTLATATILWNNQGCKEVETPEKEEDPRKEATTLLVDEWRVNTIDGVLLSDDGLEIVLDFELDGDLVASIEYDYYGTPYTYTSNGSWVWTEDAKSLVVEMDGDRMIWDVVKLDQTDLVFDYETEVYECERL